MKLDSESDAWDLEDADERHRNAPDLYTVPSLEERMRLRAGDRARLLFLFRGCDRHGAFIQSERLWVTIREASDGGYVGALESAPRSSVSVGKGELISFEPRHVSSLEFSTGAATHSS